MIPSRPADDLPITRIARRSGLGIDWAEAWRYRDLLAFLAYRDVAVRYKQTALGVLWVLLQPLLALAVFTVVLGHLVRVPSEVPYPAFALAGLLPWTYVASAVQRSAASLVGNSRLISKVYFPRFLVPLAGILSPLVDLLVVTLVTLPLLALRYGVAPTPAWLLLPLLIVAAALTAAGFGLWLSALNVQFRDVEYALPFVVQSWLLLSPVFYPASLVPEVWRPAYALNPLVGLLDAFRAVLLGTPCDPTTCLTSAAVALVVLVTGGLYFLRVERRFADVL